MHTDRFGNICEKECAAKEAEKELKYKRACIEIQRMWNPKCVMIPLIIGATGIVTKR
jgi:hypothetical protein